MKEQKSIKRAIEVQRRKLDYLAGLRQNLTDLLEEAQVLDRLVEAYEAKSTIS